MTIALSQRTLNGDIDLLLKRLQPAPGGFYTPWSRMLERLSGQQVLRRGEVGGVPDTDYIYDRFATKGQGHCASIALSGSYKDKSLEVFGFEMRFDVGGQV
jgi:hypothetical protein